MRAGDGTTLYGEVTFSNSMNTPSADAIRWGLYSFPASANTSFTQLTLHNTLCANGGGAYRKGNLHFTSYYEDMSGEPATSISAQWTSPPTPLTGKPSTPTLTVLSVST